MSNKPQEVGSQRLQEKVCIITGGASGLGEESAHLFASHGAHVIIADVQDALGQAVAAALPPPGRHNYIHCDVSKEVDVAKVVDLAVSTFSRLDVMFNNAGVLRESGPLQDLDMELFDQVLAVNVRGVALGMKYAAKVMVPAGRGCIINMASVLGTLAIDGRRCSYIASKHAVVGLTKAGAVELGKVGVRVNSVSPYVVITPMVKMKAQELNLSLKDMEDMYQSAAVLKGEQYLTAKDVANAALFLASDEASYINGHNLAVDGGYTIAGGILKL